MRVWWWVVLGCAGRPAAPGGAPAAGCEAADPARWAACADQTVTVSATRATQVQSAPLLQGPGQEQSYFEVAGTSLIVHSAAPIACDRAELTGRLRLHDQGGAAGTPESWRGWVLDAATVVCP